MKRTSAFAFALILVVFAVLMTSSVLATNSDTNSTRASSATLEPTKENVNPVTTIVNSTTFEVEALKVPATTVDSTTSTTPWLYTPIVLGAAIFPAVALVALVLKRRGYKFSRVHFLGLMVLVGLLTVPTAQVYAEENLTVSIWDLEGTGVRYPMIIRESVDSAGKVWFGSYGTNRIGYLNPSTNEVKIWITPEGIRPEVPGRPSPTTVSVDDADKIWFTDTNLQRIGRFDPSTNFFTIWPVPGIGCWSTSGYYGWLELGALPLVSIDSYGNAYFPEYLTNKIGRIDPATNQLTEWTIPTNDSNSCYTMVDSNDNVWFAEFSGNKIGRLNPYTNEITEWTIPTPYSAPNGLYVTGGLVYFAEFNAHKIGRLNPNTNEITQWSITGPYLGYPSGLFVDSNGNAWFVAGFPGSRSYSNLVRLGADNILTYWAFPSRYLAFGVTVDTKVNTGAVYVTTSYTPAPSLEFDILRFRSA